jgi:hypothetical protein
MVKEQTVKGTEINYDELAMSVTYDINSLVEKLSKKAGVVFTSVRVKLQNGLEVAYSD